MLNWKCSQKDNSALARVVARATLLANDDPDFNKLEFEMDITAAHCNSTKLNLEKLLTFDDFNFLHDVLGIQRHLDRGTGKMMNCFVPRCSRS